MNDRARNGEESGIGPAMSRRDRLRHALRENLKRRKDQKRRREQQEHNKTNENRSSSKGI